MRSLTLGHLGQNKLALNGIENIDFEVRARLPASFFSVSFTLGNRSCSFLFWLWTIQAYHNGKILCAFLSNSDCAWKWGTKLLSREHLFLLISISSFSEISNDDTYILLLFSGTSWFRTSCGGNNDLTGLLIVISLLNRFTCLRPRVPELTQIYSIQFNKLLLRVGADNTSFVWRLIKHCLCIVEMRGLMPIVSNGLYILSYQSSTGRNHQSWCIFTQILYSSKHVPCHFDVP